ncbi:MAG TPA: hypothetical protein PKK06_08995 [Phycisphaerae bacterium]|nr:hypothetical protein [Phycisphaerae bacterium]HNU45293.1 hypothetical protein [Phycisphaerae bacterium]
MLLRSSAFIGLTCLLFIVGAPATRGAPPSATGPVSPIPTPPPPPTPEQLRVLAARMQTEVETLRGASFKHPVDVGLFTESEVRDFLRQDLDGSASAAARRAHATCAHQLIGLIPPGCDVQAAFEQMMMRFVPGGIYDHRSGALRIVHKPDLNVDSLSLRCVLVHELVHALDDQYFDFRKFLEDDAVTSDMEHVWGAVFEGSAVVVQEAYTAQRRRSGDFPAQVFEQLNAEGAEQMRTLAESPAHVAVWVARFPCGIRFLLHQQPGAFLRLVTGLGGPPSIGPAVEAAAGNLPRSFEQVLHPEKYWAAATRDEPVRIDDAAVEALLARAHLRVVFRDTLGELLCCLLTTPADRKFNPLELSMPTTWTNPAAAGWGGDRLFLVTAADAPEVAQPEPAAFGCVWFTMWDTPADCAEFIAAYRAHRPEAAADVMSLGERGAVFLHRLSGPRLEALRTSLPTEPPTCTHAGRPWSFRSP